MAEYHFYGSFEIHTDSANLEEVLSALNETARQFGDIIKWQSDVNGYMMVKNTLDMEVSTVNKSNITQYDAFAEIDADEDEG